MQRPLAIALKVCKVAVVEEKTRNVSLVNCFRRLLFQDFPAPATAFTVCAVVRDGQGEIDFSLVISPLSDEDNILVRPWSARFDSPLQEKWFLIPITDISFPDAGLYEIGLFAEGEPIAHTTVEIVSEENLP